MGSDFLGELKRRNVLRVAVLYIVASWLILQITDVFSSLLPIPAWTGSFVFTLLVIGFPLALIFSWIYEVTPEGVKRETEVEAGSAVPRGAGRRMDRVLVVLIVLVIAVVAVDRLVPEAPVGAPDTAASGEPAESAEPAEPEDTPDTPDVGRTNAIAVMPFRNMSGDPNNQYFSEGISEEILNVLAKVDGLKVSSRTSSFAFADQNLDLQTIAGKLDVSYILEGSVRKVEDRVRVTAQLIDVSDDTHLWSESYEKTLADVFLIQREIAGNIVKAMRNVLGEKGDLAMPASGARPTENLQAYEYYLEGRYWLYNRTLFRTEGLHKGIDALEKAIELDPGFAEAVATLAATYVVYDGYATEFEESRYEAGVTQKRAEEYAHKAIVLDESLADAYATLGLVNRNRSDWDGAVEYSRRAIELDPGNGLSHLWYGILLVQLGHIEDAKEVLLTAADLDTTSALVAHWLADSYRILGQPEQSLFHGRRAIDLGGYSMADGVYQYYLQRGDYEKAIETLEHTERMLGNNVQVVRPLVAAVQDPEKIPALMEAAGQLNEIMPNVNLGAYYLDIPKQEFVLELLEKEGRVGRFSGYTYRLWEPQFTWVRKSGVFRKYAQQEGMVDYWTANRWPDMCRGTPGGFECD
jgi:TolB-like protein